jgi:hypothetical protein
MQEERTWRRELTWWLSASLALLAVLVPVAAVEGVRRALADPNAADALNVALGWALVLPLQGALKYWPFFVSGMLSCRLLVPTFLGVHPRVVTAVFCTAAAAFGAYVTTLDWLNTVVFGGAAFVWSQALPLPLRDVLAYRPAIAGLIVGLGLAALLHDADVALVAILWGCWRLYRDHPIEVAVMSACVAVLPLLLIADDPGGAMATTTGIYHVLETALLLCLTVGGVVLGLFLPPARSPGTDSGPSDRPA